MFALVDCNNFYVSCERVFRPELNKKPIVVLSNNDGCVIARSQEAKNLDIPMGAPAFKFMQFFKQTNTTIFSSNYALYGNMSNRVMNILSSYTPEIEIYSIDEAFLNFNNVNPLSINKCGLEIRKKVNKYTGLPVSIGFANTKTLAKLANTIAKKYQKKTGGIFIIDSEETRLKSLKWLKIEDVWGIGRKSAYKLKKIGVFNAMQFTELSDDWVRKNMSIVGLRTKHELEGKPRLDLEADELKKNIATTRSFDKEYYQLNDVRERVSTFASSCAKKLRNQKSTCNSIAVFVSTNKHTSNNDQYKKSILIKLPQPTNSSIELSKFATQGLTKIFKEGLKYKKAGVIVMDILVEKGSQMNLFNSSNTKHKSLMRAVDELNKYYGNRSLKLGSQDGGSSEKMKQEKVSPKYTTNLKDILKVNSK